MNLSKLVKSLTKSQKLALLLLPFVAIGLYFVLSQRSVNVIQAVDPLVITYDGGPPPSPMFDVSGMLPGDPATEKIFNVKNDTTEGEEVDMRFVKMDEEKNFGDILDVTVEEVGNGTLFDGKLKDLFDAGDFSLGTFPAGVDRNFRVKIKFPSEAGNEYQNARIVFNIIWSTNLPPLELPAECADLQGIITAVIEGTEDEDDIKGSPASELILAYGDRDRVDGGKGDDCIVGGEGDDRDLDGSDGNDIIIGGPGDDDIDGSGDNDILYGNEGDDKIDGSGGQDIIFGGPGNDKIDAGADDDFVDAGSGNDDVEGGSGNDSIFGGEGNDKLDGGSGKDELYGQEGDDDIKGGSSDDYLNGGADTDDLDGDSGDDECTEGETYDSCEL